MDLERVDLEIALSIPRDSAKAFVFVLNAQGNVIARVEGEPNDAKIIVVEKQSARPSRAAPVHHVDPLWIPDGLG